ncbi:putative mediator of RNA polymerase II transcription subunit 9, mediator complex, subunit Med7/Med21 [Septoria linicola]|nr:putative mediator of RNA polymerase II transcription subunit 9, mediator complex, subunit Med7/Med21 [Septoria linicola]
MALKQPIKTTTNAPAAASQRVQLQLPNPSTFDVLPKLHELLARVDAHQNASLILNDDLGLGEFDSNADIATAYDTADKFQPLNPKDLPNALLGHTEKASKANLADTLVKGIKDDIREALRSVERLPDVDRTVEEQQEEIEELEERIRQQRQMLKSLAVVAKDMEARAQGAS